MEKKDELKLLAIQQELLEIAKQKAWDDDEAFIPDDYAGGNIDDAFYGGQTSGGISMARHLLKTYFDVDVKGNGQ